MRQAIEMKRLLLVLLAAIVAAGVLVGLSSCQKIKLAQSSYWFLDKVENGTSDFARFDPKDGEARIHSMLNDSRPLVVMKDGTIYTGEGGPKIESHISGNSVSFSMDDTGPYGLKGKVTFDGTIQPDGQTLKGQMKMNYKGTIQEYGLEVNATTTYDLTFVKKSFKDVKR
jgi:hypothetical protein